MREIRLYGSEGGGAGRSPYPYQKSPNYSPDGRAGCRRARARRPDFCKAMSEWAKRRVRRAFRRTVNEVSGAFPQTERTLQCGRIHVIPAKAGIQKSLNCSSAGRLDARFHAHDVLTFSKAMLNSAEFLYVDRRVFRVGKEVGCVVLLDAPSVTEVSGEFHQTERTLQCGRIRVIPAKAGIQKSPNCPSDGWAGCPLARA